MTTPMQRLCGWALVAAALLLTGCASLPVPGDDPSQNAERMARYRRDPLEPMNRKVYAFNDAIDRVVTKPIAQAYVDYIHPGVRTMVGNVFGNLGDVWTSVNQLLQGKPVLAFSDLGRVLINTTLGFGGLGDVASEMGIEKHREDFGQTLGRWGVPTGPYLVLPVFGPSNFRDSPGLGVDLSVDPLGKVAQDGAYWSAWAARAVGTRADLLRGERLVDGAALDKYSFIRDGYLQRRRSLVYDGDPPDEDSK